MDKAEIIVTIRAVGSVIIKTITMTAAATELVVKETSHTTRMIITTTVAISMAVVAGVGMTTTTMMDTMIGNMAIEIISPDTHTEPKTSSMLSQMRTLMTYCAFSFYNVF